MNLHRRFPGRAARATTVAVALTLGTGLLVPALATPAAAATKYCNIDVGGQIEAKYRSLAPAGGDPTKGRLGCPKSYEVTPPQDSSVRWQQFAGGFIYWSPSGGAHPIWPDMKTAWNSNSGMSGAFRQPIGDEMPSPIGVGVYQRFVGGTIYVNNGFSCSVDTTTLTAGTPERGYADKIGSSNCGGSWAYITALLVNGRYKSFDTVKFRFCEPGSSECLNAAAVARQNVVSINRAWAHGSPNDFGLVSHELTHVAQMVFNYKEGWVFESMADWVRFVLGQPIYPGRPAVCDSGDRYDTLKSQCGVTLFNYVDDQTSRPWVQDLNVYLHDTADRSSIDGFMRSSTGLSLQQQWDRCRAPGKPCAGGRA